MLLKGEYDDLLPWPFKQKVTFMILDQTGTRHVCDTIRPDPNSPSYMRPNSEMNLGSGCPLLAQHEFLSTNQNLYLRNDVMYIKLIIDTSDLHFP